MAEMNSISRRALYGDSMDLFEYDDDDSIEDSEITSTILIEPENCFNNLYEEDNDYYPVE